MKLPLPVAPQLMDLLGAHSFRRRFATDDPSLAYLEKERWDTGQLIHSGFVPKGNPQEGYPQKKQIPIWACVKTFDPSKWSILCARPFEMAQVLTGLAF